MFSGAGFQGRAYYFIVNSSIDQWHNKDASFRTEAPRGNSPEVSKKMVLESYKYFKYIKKSLFRKDRLNYLILYVTSKCNSYCKSCFFYKNLNKDTDLSLEEYIKISENLGRISILLLSGGEPFLRNDLVEICSTFIENNSVNNLLIPTNGLLTQRIVEVAKILATKFPRVIISINPSLDGMQDYHDLIRGVKNSFARAITTIRELEKVKKEYKNVQIIVNSVINQDNISELKKLIVYLSGFDLDYHAFEIMRGDWRDKNLKLAGIDEIKELHKFIIEYRKQRIKNLFEKIIVIGALRYIHKIKENFLLGRSWSFRCSAGRSILVIYPDGGVSLCEIRNYAGNLRDENYDINRLLHNEKALKMLGEITRSRCSCTHICFLNASIAKEWESVFKILFYYFKK